MPSKQAIEPTYIQWHEKDFMADEEVQCMDWLQRLLYRHLCQRAPFCSTRPYIPDDDNVLWKLAGAKDKQMWMENREAVLAKWKLVRNGARPPFYSHKRVTAEYSKLVDFLDKQAAAGKASAKARKAKGVAGEPAFNGGSTTVERNAATVQPTKQNTEQKTETDNRTLNQNQVQASGLAAAPRNGGQSVEVPGQASVSDVGLDQEKGKPKNGLAAFLDAEAPGTKMPYDVIDAWRLTFPELECYAPEEDPRDCLPEISRLADSGHSLADMVDAINWLPKSDYWGRNGAGAFKQGLKSFLNAWPTIRQQRASYKAETIARKQVRAQRRGK